MKRRSNNKRELFDCTRRKKWVWSFIIQHLFITVLLQASFKTTQSIKLNKYLFNKNCIIKKEHELDNYSKNKRDK